VIKAAGTLRGKPMLLLGLSGENVTRLAAGEPMVIAGGPLGFDGYVVIVYGRTEDELKADLQRTGLIDHRSQQIEE
jgi:hypothetical protein